LYRPKYEQAESIVNSLRTAGFSTNDISVLFSDKSTTRILRLKSTPKRRKGRLLWNGGLRRWRCARIVSAIGSLAIPGVGPVIAAGPIMGALSGAAVGAATGV